MTDTERGTPWATLRPAIARYGPNRSYRPHGTHIRGADVPRRSPQFEGRFGRMFRSLPPARHDEEALRDLADKMTSPAEDAPTPEDQIDAEENIGNPGIAAGYTYLGQFIDHDLTFDPASSLQRQNDPDALIDFRTPRFDLDCVYGRGPADQPYLYRNDGVRMLLGRTVTGSAFDPNTRDVPRATPEGAEPARATLGDPRNDENTIVSQLQATMLRFHNRVADVLEETHGQPPLFEDVQRAVRWHYQWVVLHDFLPTIIGEETVRAILPQFQPEIGEKVPYTPQLKFYHPRDNPFMPIEFSVAAYRFGHSMVRPIYRLNTTMADRIEIFHTVTSGEDTSLAGFRAFPADRAVDWTLFFPIEDRPDTGPTRVQPAYKIDTSLVNPLGNLPESVVGDDVHALAARNLLRGLTMSLPSGQAVARFMHLPVVPDEKLRIQKATDDPGDKGPLLVDINPEFRNNAPLWCYILAEAQQAFEEGKKPIRLGPVGGRIVGEVFVGLLTGDTHSYVNQYPAWQPFDDFVRKGRFGMAELILQAKEGG